MSIVRPKPPEDVVRAFSKGLPAFLATPAGATEAYVGEASKIPSMADLGTTPDTLLHNAQQIFVLGLRDAASNAGIGAATPFGWRIFAGTVRGKIVMGRLSCRPQPVGWKLTAAFYGDRVWDALQASTAIDSFARASMADYELRVLAVPGLNLETYWLVDQSTGRSHLAVPIPAAPKPHPIGILNREPAHPMPNFLSAIRPLAQLRMTARSVYGS
jgi:hypothetical protein